MRFSAGELAAGLDGRLVGPDVAVDGLSIDSRLLTPGQLFAAVRAERDGHDFVAAARTAGAAAVLVEREEVLGDGPVAPDDPGTAIVVDDVGGALLQLARLARARLPERVVGVTGSVGKTTTKDLLATVLAQEYPTAASEKSFNNEIGVPLTLANAPEGTQAAVVEMGARGAGHIALLCDLARPTVGVVTTVEGVHTEVMGGLEQIALAKGELIEALPADGLAVLNSDVRLVAAMAERTAARVLTFGAVGDVRARDVAVDDELRPSFVLVSPWGEAMVRLGIRGVHNVANALAAAAVGLALDVPLERVAAGLADAGSSPWRMDLRTAPSGVRVLNDAYNAGPASMAAALRSLAALPLTGGAGRRVAVLGLMAELGDDAPREHRDVATIAADLGIEVLAVGTDLYGVEPLADVAAALAELAARDLRDGDVVLVKGSRVAGLERVAAALID
ncbi:MAG: UDP-N-acetylmuramoyl-tripeptide--D-alanyl-D-alanine ligase [Microthrixaceae bacterium]